MNVDSEVISQENVHTPAKEKEKEKAKAAESRYL